MIRDITIGQYYQGSSLIHRLDPRLKVVGVLVYLISLFCFRYVIGFLVQACFSRWCCTCRRCRFAM